MTAQSTGRPGRIMRLAGWSVWRQWLHLRRRRVRQWQLRRPDVRLGPRSGGRCALVLGKPESACEVVAAGTPEQVNKREGSHTAEYLRPKLESTTREPELAASA